MKQPDTLLETVALDDGELNDEFDDEVRRAQQRAPQQRRAKPGTRKPPAALPQRPRAARTIVPRAAAAAPISHCPAHGTESVRWVQSTLNRLQGLSLPIDGVMSPATRSALRAFQEQRRLPADGIAGPDTERALMDAAAPAGAAAPAADASGDDAAAAAQDAQELETLDLEFDTEWEGEVNRSSRDYVMWVQRSLNKILLLQLDVDGISGPMTRSAVRDFQTRQHLAVDGIVGPQTEGALIGAGAGNPPGYAGPSVPADDGVHTYPTRPTKGGSGGFPTSQDGTPIFSQSDSRWGNDALGEPTTTISRKGCAMTSMAMAISKISGKLVTPETLDAYLDAHNGYDGDNIRWDTAAQMVGLRATRIYLSGWSLKTIDGELSAGRPVVVGVTYDADPEADHWIAVTRRSSERGKWVYYANDPRDGTVIKLALQGSQFSYAPRDYRSTGDLVVLSR